mmetsp:Transcript_32468/g.76278  ORF Transcript_32468/g.76278 Transcript_32468/m.76278 type:complete len:255 (-) Transcript_32468:282-1046(-)
MVEHRGRQDEALVGAGVAHNDEASEASAAIGASDFRTACCICIPLHAEAAARTGLRVVEAIEDAQRLSIGARSAHGSVLLRVGWEEHCPQRTQAQLARRQDLVARLPQLHLMDQGAEVGEGCRAAVEVLHELPDVGVGNVALGVAVQCAEDGLQGGAWRQEHLHVFQALVDLRLPHQGLQDNAQVRHAHRHQVAVTVPELEAVDGTAQGRAGHVGPQARRRLARLAGSHWPHARQCARRHRARGGSRDAGGCWH